MRRARDAPSRSEKNVQAPLRWRLGQTKSPDNMKKNDIRKTSSQAQNRSKPSHRWLSTIGKLRHKNGGLSNGNGWGGRQAR